MVGSADDDDDDDDGNGGDVVVWLVVVMLMMLMVILTMMMIVPIFHLKVDDNNMLHDHPNQEVAYKCGHYLQVQIYGSIKAKTRIMLVCILSANILRNLDT